MSQRIPRSASSYWPAFAGAALVVSSTSFNAVTADAIVVAMPLMVEEFGNGHDARFLVQMISVAPSISIIVGSLCAGFVRRLVGFRSAMLPGLVVYVIAGLYGLVPQSGESLIVSRVLLGFVSGLLGTICLSLAAEFESQKAARLLGFANAMASATAIGSFVVGGWLAREFGWRLANLAYVWPLSLIPFVLAYQTERSRQHGTVSDENRAPPFPFKAVLPVYLVTLVFFMSVFSTSIEGPFLLDSRGLKDPTLIGIAISGSAVCSAIFGLNYGRISRGLDRATQFAAIFGFFLASATIASFAKTPLSTTFGLSLAGCASGMLSPLLLSTLVGRVPRARAAEATSGYVSATYISVFAAPSVFSAITRYTPFQVFECLAIVAATALLVTIILGRTGRIAKS